MIECPVADWRPDEVAECLDGLSSATYARLWNIVSELEHSGRGVPLGGDGSGGTVEVPPEPDAFASGRMSSIWHQLSDEQRLEIANLASAMTNK
jgi:hypothetical protein